MSLQSPTNQQQQLQQQQQQKSPGHQQLTGEQSALMQTLPSDQPHGGQFQALINAGQPLALQQAARSITPLPASATRQSSSPSVANPDTRTHVVGELYDTERSYVESLQILVEKYMKPLKSLESSRALIDSSLVDEIFCTIPEILQHHETFLSALQDRLSSDWDTSQVIGNVFIEAFTNQQIIDTYTAFINNWKNARQAIKIATQAKPAFERFLEAMSREHRNKLTLDALLIMPVQRIPRYELLIKELIKHTPDDHPDYGPLIEAQKEIHELALKIDRAEKEMIHQEQLKDLESLIEGHIELQHPQRDFIRYDLVSVFGTSTLTAAKKERVLFLFCDLLIITSVKKKASRRSNLQAAFANSSNDLSLLEGTKFKLLLRVSLDQVEIRLANDQIQLQQQQEQQHQLQLQTKLIQDQRRKIEADLYILHQIESLSFKLNLAERTKINEIVYGLTHNLRQNLSGLEQADAQSLVPVNRTPQPFQDLRDPVPAATTASVPLNNPYPSQQQHSASPNAHNIGQTSSSQMQQQDQTNTIAPSSIPAAPPVSIQHSSESNISLEFIICNKAALKETTGAILNSSSVTNEWYSGEQGFVVSNQAQNASMDTPVSNQQSANSETLVVTFASIDRRQAFLQAFIEAKQQRCTLQLQQQRQTQQQKIFSSSMTLRLAQPIASETRTLSNDSRRTKLQHQDNVEARSVTSSGSSSLRNRTPTKAALPPSQTIDSSGRISSAPMSNQASCGSSIVHQMSAPQSLALAAVSFSQFEPRDRDFSQCSSFSSNLALESQERPLNHSHHHHQLMHQPASQPASLDTICCHEQHDNFDKPSITRSNFKTDGFLESTGIPTMEKVALGCNSEEVNSEHGHRTYNSVVALGSDFLDEQKANTSASQQALLLGQMNQALLFRSAPKFIISMPMDFLTTRHPALQLTCSTLEYSSKSRQQIGSQTSLAQKCQNVRDSSGKLWLCMSNGYVSHIALISMRKQWLRKRNNQVCKNSDHQEPNMNSERYYDIVPIIRSAGDICKSHINCGTQVKWKKPGSSLKSRDSTKHQATVQDDTKSETEPAPTVGLSIKSASPPVDIISPRVTPSQTDETEKSQIRLSESAPSHSEKNVQRMSNFARSSASTTRLEVPSTRTDRTNNSTITKREVIERSKPLLNTICRHSKVQENRSSSSASSRSPQLLHRNSSESQHQNEHHRTNRHHHNHSHQHHSHYPYAARHNTIPIAELRRSLERQHKVCDRKTVENQNRSFVPPSNTPDCDASDALLNQKQLSSLDLANDHLENLSPCLSGKKVRATTPPSGYIRNKGFRPARMLRHQASLKTSSILAKLVGGASRKSSYLRKSNQTQDKQSDADENDTDTDQQYGQSTNTRQDDTFSVDSTILALTTPGASKCVMTASETNNAVISPLSSMSSLNSTNSSMTVNSVCASSPNRSSCDLLAHSSSVNCCLKQSTAGQTPFANSCFESRPSLDECGIRSRSATVPCRKVCEYTLNSNAAYYLANNTTLDDNSGDDQAKKSYKVSEIIENAPNQEQNVDPDSREAEIDDCVETSLWLGCEDGSLIIFDCLNDYLGDSGECNFCDLSQRTLNCGNVHSEIKLGAAVCDIYAYKDSMVFVALSNGQLVIFSREEDSNKDNNNQYWSLTNPKLLTVTANELNSTSKLCLVDDEYLWYSYGRNIFVLNIKSLKLEITIMAPTNDLSLQFSMQSITIDNMELMSNLSGVWISFKNNHLIQFYDVKRYKLLIELNLFVPVNKMLSFGNEIIRQHKTACLKATSLLNVYSSREQCNTLYIGTSAGIILYLNLTSEQLALREPINGSSSDWIPQIASLRHGHSGHVKFLHVLEVEEDRDQESEQLVDGNNNGKGGLETDAEIETFLISGGAGVDVYGPESEQSGDFQSNGDNLNYLMLWKM